MKSQDDDVCVLAHTTEVGKIHDDTSRNTHFHVYSIITYNNIQPEECTYCIHRLWVVGRRDG